ncbi:MAG: ATPase [Solimicrobium sp.]|jgi:cell division protein ZapE|nr:ATPase [Solimicrobium sp.]
MNVIEFYQHALHERGFKADAAQWVGIQRLQQTFNEWLVYKNRRSNKLIRMIKRPEVPRGVYMWGGVGRGKSFLMDSFYHVVPIQRKIRVHFHEFMRGIHQQLDELRGVANPLDKVAKKIAKKYRLICFDEFHISDVADAMIMFNLLSGLFDYGVSFIMTSNYQPEELYPDGLHRDRILSTIKLLNEKLDVINVDSGNDYRQRALEQVNAYLTPLNVQADTALRLAFKNIAETADEDALLRIESREIRALRRAGGIIWFDFATLCGGPRSQNDYLEIASQFHTVILSGVPHMSASMSSEARRFTWLIDVFYDRKIKLIMSAEVAPDELYTEGTLSNEFHRTVSRIIEMQSREYMDSKTKKITDALV